MRQPNVRPRKPPRTIDERIVRYIDDTFDGNLTTAAADIGCGYHQLWRAANGLSVKAPPTDLLAQLAAHSGKPIEWWLTGDTAHAH